MNRCFFVAIMLILFSSIFTCCNRYDEDYFMCTCGKVELNKKEYVAMCIIPKEVTVNSVNRLRMENHIKGSISYGEDFSIEYLNEDNWETIEDNLMTQAILYGLQSGIIEVDVLHYPLYSYVEAYNDAKKGKYRLIKPVCLNGRRQEIYLVAEFEVK